MIVGTKNLLIGGVLLLLVLGSGWLNRATDRKSDYPPAAHTPDYFLNHFTAVTMSEKGKPDKQLFTVED